MIFSSYVCVSTIRFFLLCHQISEALARIELCWTVVDKPAHKVQLAW